MLAAIGRAVLLIATALAVPTGAFSQSEQKPQYGGTLEIATMFASVKALSWDPYDWNRKVCCRALSSMNAMACRRVARTVPASVACSGRIVLLVSRRTETITMSKSIVSCASSILALSARFSMDCVPQAAMPGRIYKPTV